MYPRLLSEKCTTCIFRAGNLMRLRPGRLQEMVTTTLARGATITCHDTLTYGRHPRFGEAVCRGFYDSYGQQSQVVQTVERLGGFYIVDPPKDGKLC